MFHKKKFTLVNEKKEKKMYSARYNYKWVKYVVLLALVTFISIMVLANVKSKGYYQEKKVSETPAHNFGIRSITSFYQTSTRAPNCSAKTCAVTCFGDMTNLNKYLQSLAGCTSYTLRISEATFPDDRLPSNWLQGNFVLSLIVIKTSTLREISNGAFNHNAAANIKELELNAVQLESLTENTFVGLKAIKTFKLVNKISKFLGDAFLKGMEKTLEKIEIQHVTSIPTDPAPWLRGSNFDKIITIVFDGSNLGGYINADTFQHTSGVQIIMLNSCKITHIADGTFDFLMNKIFFLLSLQNNQLKRLRGEYLKKVGSLKGVDLLNNPWDCTCELEELIREFKRYPDGFNNKTECKSPPEFAGKRMDTVDVERCEDTTTVFNTPSPPTMAPTPSSSTKDPDPKPTPSTAEPPKSSESTPPSFATEPDPKPTPSTVTSPNTLPPLTTEPPTSTYGTSSDSTPTTRSSETPTTATPNIASTPVPSTTEPPKSSSQSTPPSVATEPDPKPTTSTVTSPNTLPPLTTEPPTSTYGSSSDSTPTTGSAETPTTGTPKNTSTSDPATQTTPITTMNDDGGTILPPQTTPSPQNRTTTLSEDTIFVECQRYTVESSKSVNEPEFFVELSRPDTHFGITSLSQTSAQLEIDNPSGDLALIWFYDQPNTTGSGENTRIVGEFKMGCQSVLENLLIIEGLAQKRAYTFCLVRAGIQVISPFNCLSFFSNAEGIGLVDESDVWLKREDQALIIGLLIVGIIISICLGIVGMYMLLRLNPSLLKGSKRVIVVNRSTGDVLILPKPCTKSSMTDSEFCYKNTFGANTTVRQRRFSETSIQSGLSYMVANNYEDIEYRWKMNVVNDMIYANRVPKSPAPPLPKRVSQDKTASKDSEDKMKVSVILPKGNDYGYVA